MKMESASSATSPSLTSSTKSTEGRDRAVEILLDQDPLGSYYRAIHAIEETIPNARATRPNLITKAALVEQAFSLSKYAIDTLKKYDEAYPAPEHTPVSTVDALSRERVLSHFNRTLAVSSSSNPSDQVGAVADTAPETPKSTMTSTPSLSPSTAALVADLRKVFDEPKEDFSREVVETEERTFELRRLLKNVTSHPVVSASSASNHKQQMERMIANLCKMSPFHSYDDKEPLEDDYLQGLLLAILSLLISPQEEIGEASTKPREPTEQTTMLQVAPLLALLPVSKDGDQFAIEPGILEYFGKAVAVSVERLEIKKARMLQRLQSAASSTGEGDEEEAPGAEVEESGNSPTLGQNDALHEAFEQFVSTMTHAADASLDYPLESLEHLVASVARSEGAEIASGDTTGRLYVDDPIDYPGLSERREPSSSSSSSDSSDSDDSSEFFSDGEEDEDNDNDVAAIGSSGHHELEPSSILGHGLDSSANTSSNVTVDMESSNIILKEQQSDESLLNLPEIETSLSCGERQHVVSRNPSIEGSVHEDDETDLPPMPARPSQTLLWGFDRKNSENIYDPSSSTFGTIPDTHVLIHMLRHTSLMMNRRPANSLGGNDTWDSLSIPGGIGSHLFSTVVSAKGEVSKRNDDLKLHLLVALVARIDEKRNESIQCLQKSIARENRTTETPTCTPELSNSLDDDEAPLSSGEEDDPAMALALNYVEDDVPLSSESLENKGMRRKAAAAAHDSAALLISRQKETREWIEHACLYSQCLVYSLRLLRLFLQSSVRSDCDANGAKDEYRKSFYLNSRLPKAVAVKLSSALSSLMSCQSYVAFRSAIGKDAESLLVSLYTESVSTWCDCVPLLYPSFDSVADLLQKIIYSAREVDYSWCSERKGLKYESLGSITKVPSHSSEVDVHRLQVLSRRLRVWDMLDLFVLRPVPFTDQADDQINERLSSNLSIDVPLASSVINLLGLCLDDLEGASDEVQKLYLALCHRFHERIILMDGLHATTKTEADDAATNVNRHKNLPTGDYLRISTSPSSLLEFDGTKCADSIAILSNSEPVGNRSSVHQRANKNWGTVLATRHFAPKTGIHRWAFRLDKCERGHVFLGVATSQCNVKTYVGGDKFGFGMIGTTALWHDRRKIRGDYGSTLRTGAIIIATLDTDAGTLSFGLWKDGSSVSSQPMDSSPSAMSLKGHQFLTGSVEDFGIAFEGLPLDSRLFPAIGLYQRDDRVSLLSVVDASGSPSGLGIPSQSIVGEHFYPMAIPLSASGDLASRVRKFNERLCYDGVRYATETLLFISETMNQKQDHVVFTKVLPSLASSLCLLPPSVPILSARSAILLLPHIRRFLETCTMRFSENFGDTTTITEYVCQGKWLIRATGNGSGKHDVIEEYIVDIVHPTGDSGEPRTKSFQGSGRGTVGKLKNGNVVIKGTQCGTSLSFVEEWYSDSEDNTAASISSSIVNARLSRCGDKFEGTFVKYGKSGRIAGKLVDPQRAPLSSIDDDNQRTSRCFHACQVSLAMAQGHLSALLCDSTDLQRIDIWIPHSSCEYFETRKTSLRQIIDLPIFSSCSLEHSYSSHCEMLDFLKLAFLSESSERELCGIKNGHFLEPVRTIFRAADDQNTASVVDFDSLVDESDMKLADLCGGKGSLRPLCPNLYTTVRRRLLRVFLQYRGCLVERDIAYDEHDLKMESDLEMIWRGALRITEDGVRKALSQSDGGVSRKSVVKTTCERFLRLIDFLLEVRVERQTIEDISLSLSVAFEVVSTDEDVDFLRKGMSLASGRAILRLLAMKEVSDLLSKTSSNKVLTREAISLALPRILGRGRSIRYDVSSLRKTPLDSALGIGGTYSSGLAGASFQAMTQLKAVALSIYSEIGTITEEFADRLESGLLVASDSTVASALLSILPVFACQFKVDGFEEFLSAVKIMRSLPRLLSVYRRALLATINERSEHVHCFVSRELAELYKRDLYFSVLRCSSAVGYVLVFQAASFASQKSDIKIASEIISLILNEIAALFPVVETNWRDSLGSASVHQVDDDYERWMKVMPRLCGNTITSRLEKQTEQSVPCLEFVRMFGIHSIAENKAKEFNFSSEKSFVASSFHEILSQWLQAQCAMFRSPFITKEVANSTDWVFILLKVAGVTVHFANGSITDAYLRPHSEGVLPSRFRTGILRMMIPLLTEVESNTCVVESLFELAGVTSPIISHSLDGDECHVSIECVSLLRRLYSHAHGSWRSCINLVISNITNPSYDLTNGFRKKIGVLSFFAGNLKGISLGSYVILKSTNAVALAAEHSGVSNKSASPPSSTGPSGSSHHLVGNGTEHIVAGLCSDEATAGIVSSIDMKNGLCEVILFPRDHLGKTVGVDKSHLQAKRKGTGERRSLPVRALRTSLSDAFLAQEVPLYLDESLPAGHILGKLLNNTVSTLVSAISMKQPEELRNSENSGDVNLAQKDPNQESVICSDDTERGQPKDSSNSKERARKSVKSGVVALSCDVLLIRACIVVLSQEDVLNSFMKDEANRRTLNSILDLAWPKVSETASNADFILDVRSKSLSFLSLHETRLGYLTTLLQDVSFRSQVLQRLPDENLTSKLERFLRTETKPIGPTSSPRRSSHDGADCGGDGERSRDRAARHSNQLQHSNSRENISEDEDDSDATNAAMEHREAAIAQMAELGLPRSWSEFALRRVGGLDIEAAVTFCLECGGEIERLLAEEAERTTQRETSGGSEIRRMDRELSPANYLIRQLKEMGFPRRWCIEAIAVAGNNLDEALTWILSNGERLSEEDEAMGAAEDCDEDDDDGEEGNDEDEELRAGEEERDDAQALSPNSNLGWNGSVTPLRFISGRSIIDPVTLEISGLPDGGFSSVGTKGILLTTGKWYYEATLLTAGCLQIGWADGSFSGHCDADRGDGCGDGPSSWAYDGWRRYRWHSTATEWGSRWMEGDIVGCMVDMDAREVSFTLNGKGESVGMGLAFSGDGFRPCGGVYACVSFNRKEKLRLRLGGKSCSPFQYPPPEGFRGVGDAVFDAVIELDAILEKERILGYPKTSSEKAFLCDFSDGEHGHELMAWGHRYYGADASVHLGAGISKQAAIKVNSQPHPIHSPDVYLSRRLENAWSSSSTSVTDNISTTIALRASLQQGYREVEEKVAFELFNECIVVAILLSRKLILHTATGMGGSFDPSCFVDNGDRSLEIFGQIWSVLEACASLRSSGWAGEAGAMAIAAEALGLGITSNDPLQNKSVGDRSGLVPALDLDTGLVLPVCGASLLLSSTSRRSPQNQDKMFEFLTKAEIPLGSAGGGGVTSFMQESLQSAAYRSTGFRNILIASVRRAVRLLAVIEYDGDDSSDHGEKSEEKEEREYSTTETPDTKPNEHVQPDPRLISFISGLVLSKLVESNLPTEFSCLQSQIAEAWALGLLSANLTWRMICAFTVAGIINSNPSVLPNILGSSSTLARYFGRLPSTVLRRVWAERAAAPVVSRYAQSMIELLSAVKRAARAVSDLPDDFTNNFTKYEVDAATPIPLDNSLDLPRISSDQLWVSNEGWACSDSSWVTWLGQLSYEEVNWKAPTRSSVPALMDAGDGPPFLGVGCIVLRGPDWTVETNEDGKDKFDNEKRQQEIQNPVTNEAKDTHSETDLNVVEGQDVSANATADPSLATHQPSPPGNQEDINVQRKSSPRLPTGTVLSVEAWNGQPASARRVRWHLTNLEGVYRFGGDGGRFDICHVEVNKKATRVKKRHPLPESAEQCAHRHGFGQKHTFGVILRLERSPVADENPSTEGSDVRGVLEIPAFGAGILVTCSINSDGTMLLKEERLLYGSKDSGWEKMFGQPSFVPGRQYKLGVPEPLPLGPEDACMSLHQEIRGSYSFEVVALRNPENGKTLTIESEIRFRKPLTTSYDQNDHFNPGPPPFTFDPQYLAESLALSKDCRTVTCVGSNGRSTAFADVGFTKGVHYWEVKLEQADIGSVFIGVAEKNNGTGTASAFDSSPRLNRWLGWGFVNFRATYTSGAERIYGIHSHSGDTVGVLLDCDAGRLSFFFDGLKYGEHLLNDLGCAFENLSPFGFNVNGCGTGGAGQGAPNGFDGSRGPVQGAVRPRTLFPVIGLRNQGDRVTISSKWNTSLGIDGTKIVNNILAIEEVISRYSQSNSSQSFEIPDWLTNEAFLEYKRWSTSSFNQCITRGSGPHRMASFGLDVVLDISPRACAAASASLGLDTALLAGDRVRLTRSAGRVLELTEEATILGSYHGKLYYRIVSQKSEGGSLTEGGGRAWTLDESEVVDGLPHVTPAKGHGVPLPKLSKFRCPSSAGLNVVHESGAVLRSDLEINDGSIILGTIPVGTLLSIEQVTERRVNSCGVVRYRIQHAELGEGWISARIRGGREEVIVVPVKTESETDLYTTPSECAREWYDNWITEGDCRYIHQMFLVEDVESFKAELTVGIFPGLTTLESDSLIVTAVNAVSNLSESGDSLELNFQNLASALANPPMRHEQLDNSIDLPASKSNRHITAALASVRDNTKNLKAIMTRVAFLRALNRRIRLALPWMSIRPCQEGSAILGGTTGHGAAVERSGRSRLNGAQSNWVQVPGVASALRQCRELIFTSVKREFIQCITEATTTPTPLSHDEYELPREIRTVRINRLKAGRTMMANDVGAKRKYSVFSQLRSETKNWGGAALRRGYIAKGHGGQKRAFKVKLIGEGVNDYSGPYREVFTDAMREVSQIEGNGLGSLGVLDATPNNVSDVGEYRGLYMFSLNGRVVSSEVPRKLSARLDALQNSFGVLTLPRDEISCEVEDSLVFLGRIVGTAFRHGISVDLPLPIQSVWKALTEEECDLNVQLEELDYFASRQLNYDKDFSGSSELILWQRRLLNSFTEGLSSVLPVELFPILTGEELRESICGNPEVDVDLLKKVVEIEGFEKDAEVIDFFWETLREMTNIERMQFLQFVWARNRLPLRESGFDAPFKILKDSINQGEKADMALPSASTCFFSLTLPDYSSKEILRNKLLFAIRNVTTMETDFQTNSAEISEGYRAF